MRRRAAHERGHFVGLDGRAFLTLPRTGESSKEAVVTRPNREPACPVRVRMANVIQRLARGRCERRRATHTLLSCSEDGSFWQWMEAGPNKIRGRTDKLLELWVSGWRGWKMEQIAASSLQAFMLHNKLCQPLPWTVHGPFLR